MQISSLTGSASNIISHAQQKASNAAQEIANLSTQDSEVGGSKNVAANDLFKPVLSMKEAEQQTYAGIKMLNDQKNMLGSIISVKV